MEANSNFNMQELKDDVSIITVTEPFDLTDPHVQPIDMFMAGMAGCIFNFKKKKLIHFQFFEKCFFFQSIMNDKVMQKFPMKPFAIVLDGV